MTLWRGWWPGQTVDHLYERCPALQRVTDDLGHRRDARYYVDTEIDPEGGDICGWCLRVWRARPSDGPQSVQGSPSTDQPGFVALADAPAPASGRSALTVDR